MQDQNNKSYFENSKQSGAITGNHADIILMDDPIDPEGAASKVELEYTNKWMEERIELLNLTRKAKGNPE